MYLNIEKETLETLGALNTAKEITQQPDTIVKVLNNFKKIKSTLHAFTSGILQKENARVILTGAGTSAFAGNSIVNYLKNKTNIRFEAISTTDLVSNPHLYFEKETPTLLVSFARSGNSPESVEATKLADQLLDDSYHLAVTCNKEGMLYSASFDSDNYFAMLMPDESNDVGFAMTSSFTSMMIGTLLAFDFDGEVEKSVENISETMRDAITQFNNPIKLLADKKYERIVYLGSGDLKGLAEECALKFLELTDGGAAVMFDSPLGFRHGPKSFINHKTLVVVMVSNDKHTQKFDLDLIREVKGDGIAQDIVTINSNDPLMNGPNDFKFKNSQHVKDIDLILPFIAWAQIFSVHSSIAHGISTDTPCASGAVNRVVQGVILHKLQA
jgi:tagatose-6-phosphate ketose/aldose isomerase